MGRVCSAVQKHQRGSGPASHRAQTASSPSTRCFYEAKDNIKNSFTPITSHLNIISMSFVNSLINVSLIGQFLCFLLIT